MVMELIIDEICKKLAVGRWSMAEKPIIFNIDLTYEKLSLHHIALSVQVLVDTWTKYGNEQEGDQFSTTFF